MRMLWLAWLVLISSDCVHTDGRFPDGYRWGVTFNLSCEFRPEAEAAFEKGGKSDFQVVYIQDFHYFISSIPISFVI